nr:DUF5131 family protein [Thioalkalivibrio nitratireducens]
MPARSSRDLQALLRRDHRSRDGGDCADAATHLPDPDQARRAPAWVLPPSQLPAERVAGVSVEDRQYGLPRIDRLREVQARIRFGSVEPLLEDLGTLDLTGIHWVIVGGESGPRARPMRPEWVDNVRRQTEASGAAFFFKQWGAWGADGRRRAKKANGRVLNGRTWDETPGRWVGS